LLALAILTHEHSARKHEGGRELASQYRERERGRESERELLPSLLEGPSLPFLKNLGRERRKV